MEFALVLPLFLLLVMGALDYGYFFFSNQIVTNAAREGARAGTLVSPPPAASATVNATNNAKSVAKSYMNGNGVTCPGGTADDTCIAVTFPVLTGTTAVQVRIDYAFTSLTGFLKVILPNRVQAQSAILWF